MLRAQKKGARSRVLESDADPGASPPRRALINAESPGREGARATEALPHAVEGTEWACRRGRQSAPSFSRIDAIELGTLSTWCLDGCTLAAWINSGLRVPGPQ
jgi:hypothetical protein